MHDHAGALQPEMAHGLPSEVATLADRLAGLGYK